MDGMKTLSELCSSMGVSRRAVQGYEKAGLVTASGKNKYGYLLYDEAAQGKVKQIKLFQQAGFKVREIKGLLEVPGDVLKPILQQRIEYLKAEIRQKEEVIREVEELVARL